MHAIYHFKSTHLHIAVCGILIERDRFKMFELLRIWYISQYLAAPFSHCKIMIDNMVDSSGPYFIWHASLFLLFCLFLCFASVPFNHASLLLFFLSAVDPDYFLDVHDRICNSCTILCLHFLIEGSSDAPLSYFKKLVYIHSPATLLGTPVQLLGNTND